MNTLTSSVEKWSLESSTNKGVQFTHLFNVNGVLIHVPYQSPNESLLLLLKPYLEITEYK
jgi:hypothetical protein